MSEHLDAPPPAGGGKSWKVPPWLLPDWQALLARHDQGTMPHAVMLQGIQGIGKQAFAGHAANTLLCEVSGEAACGDCASCKLLAAGTHPDLRILEPLAKEVTVNKEKVLKQEATIKVDAIRALSDWLRLTPHFNAYRIAIIRPAEAMTISAANALLKTLEEPARHCLLMLLVTDSGSLPATVRSRCQLFQLAVRDRSTTIDWLVTQQIQNPESALDLALGGPYSAVSAAAPEAMSQRERLLKVWINILQGRASVALSAKSISEIPTREILQCFSSLVADTVKLAFDPSSRIRNSDVREQLLSVVNCMSHDDWFTLYDQLLVLHRGDSASFKTLTVLEGIFADIRLKHLA